MQEKPLFDFCVNSIASFTMARLISFRADHIGVWRSPLEYGPICWSSVSSVGAWAPVLLQLFVILVGTGTPTFMILMMDQD